MAEIRQLKDLDRTTDILPVTNTKAIYDDNGNRLDNTLSFPDGVGFYPDVKDGVRGYNTDAARGADTFHPFTKVATGQISLVSGENTIEIGFRPTSIAITNVTGFGLYCLEHLGTSYIRSGNKSYTVPNTSTDNDLILHRTTDTGFVVYANAAKTLTYIVSS